MPAQTSKSMIKIWSYSVSKVRELCEKLEIQTEEMSKVSILDSTTNAILYPGFNTDELTNFCHNESDTFDDFNVINYKS